MLGLQYKDKRLMCCIVFKNYYKYMSYLLLLLTDSKMHIRPNYNNYVIIDIIESDYVLAFHYLMLALQNILLYIYIYIHIYIYIFLCVCVCVYVCVCVCVIYI